MQTEFRDGHEELKETVSAEEIQEALDDPEVVRIHLHKSGSTFKTKKGKFLTVIEGGKLRGATRQERWKTMFPPMRNQPGRFGNQR